MRAGMMPEGMYGGAGTEFTLFLVNGDQKLVLSLPASGG